MRLWVAVLASGCFAMTPPVQFGAGKSPEEAQHQEIAEMTPPQLGADREWTDKLHVQKIRVWADDQYRAENLSWQRTFQDTIDYANTVLDPLLGLKLVADFRTWQRNEPAATLADDLAELQKLDPGNDVFAVVGLTSSLPLVSATYDQIGLASLPGKHMMLRGFNDAAERKAFSYMFKDLRPDEREYALVQRGRHKRAAVFLHELGHNLGAPHEDDTNTLMAPNYSEKSATYDDRSRAIIMLTFDRRLGRTRPQSATPVVAAATKKHPTLAVTIDAAGAPSVGGQTLDDKTLDELLKLSFTDDPDTEVAITADSKAHYAAAYHVLERANAAGLKHVSVNVDSP